MKIKQNKEEYEKKSKELTDLLTLHKDQYIKIFFADESGFSMTSNIPYGWQKKGEPLSTSPVGSARLNVFGIMSPENQLFSYSKTGSVKSDFIIESINHFVSSITEPAVIVLDNARIHHSEPFKAQIPGWKEQGVEIFYLPTYSPHLNCIETLWRKIKYEWLRPIDFSSWDTLKLRIAEVLNGFGDRFLIDFTL